MTTDKTNTQLDAIIAARITDTATPGETYRPLSALLAERRREMNEKAAQLWQASERERERLHRAAIDYAEDWMQRHISRELCAALRAAPACDDDRLDDETRPASIEPEAWAACILIDLSDAPEIDPGATPADRDTGRWRLRQRHSDDQSGARWEVYHAPQSFTANLWPIHGADIADNNILDALETFADWRARMRRP